MSTFTTGTSPNTVVLGVGPATEGLRLHLLAAQTVGAPALRGGFRFVDAAQEDALSTHFGDVLAHNDYKRLRTALRASTSFEDAHATLVAALDHDPRRMHVVNDRLFHPRQWMVESVGAGCGCGVKPCGCGAEDPVARLRDDLAPKDSASTLARLKAAWANGGLREWFEAHPEKREVVQAFVYGKCASSGMKSYDELNGIELLLRHGLDDKSYAAACDALGIGVTAGRSAADLPSFLGGGAWDGAYLGFDPSKQAAFHAANLALIQKTWTLPTDWGRAAPPQQPRRLCVVTDPRTDPTEDDAATLCALIHGNAVLKVWSHIDVLVTGCAGSLDARHAGVAALATAAEGYTVRLAVAPVKRADNDDGKKKDRFLAPYGGTDGDGDHALEEAAVADRLHVVGRIPSDTTQLLVIGQVPEDFFRVLAEASLPELQDVSIQGPGFNLMGVFGQDDVGADIAAFRKTKPACALYWSDNASGLRISSKQADERIEALGTLNASIPAMRAACVTSFWATAGKHAQFESQFGDGAGYVYARDTVELLQKLSTAV